MIEYGLPMSESLRTMRIAKCPLDCGEGIFVEDRLESGVLKMYEYLGGTFYIPQNAEEMKHSSSIVPIAGILVSILEEEGVLQVNKIYCEFGYEDLIDKLIEQIINFADFYGLVVSILDLRKNPCKKNKRICRFDDTIGY